MRKRFLLLIGLVSCGGLHVRRPAAGDALIVDGKVDMGAMGLTLAELSKLPQRSVRGAEPRSGRAAAYSGTALQPLLTDDLPLKRGADLAVFYGRGGYRVPVPFNAIRQSRPVLAATADGKPLDEVDRGTGPLLLAWPDAEAPGLDSDPRQRWWWVRGVERIEIASWQESYGRALRVPPGAGDDARHGADAFAAQCINCHRLRGQGGTVGPDLSGPLTVNDGDRMAALLRDHLGARSGMPGAPAVAPFTARQIWSFLSAVRATGDRQDEPQEPQPPPVQPQRPY